MARSQGEPFWTRQARTIVFALIPGFLAAIVLTAALLRVGQQVLLPGIWMLMWGVSCLGMGFFTPRVISLLGSTFLAAGTLILFSGIRDDAITMGLTFGAIHLAYGIRLQLSPVLRRRSEPKPLYEQ
jgi:hypothetical protein